MNHEVQADVQVDVTMQAEVKVKMYLQNGERKVHLDLFLEVSD